MVTACEWFDGSKFWFQNDERHRVDGPAIEYISGYRAWYLNGEKIICKNNEEFLRLVKLKAFW